VSQSGAVAGVVPAGLEEGVEGVGLPFQHPAVQLEATPFGVGFQRRLHAVEHHVLRQQGRQALRGDGDFAALRKVEHGDRSAPVALPRNTPVAQAVLRGHPPGIARCKRSGDGLEGFLERHAIELSGAGQRTLVYEGAVADISGLSAVVAYDADDRQAVTPGEGVIALVMSGHAHNRAGAVIHEHIIGDPYRYRVTGERMTGAQTRVHAFLLRLRHIRLGHRCLTAVGDKSRQCIVTRGQRETDRVLRRQAQVGDTEQRVRPRGVNLDRRLSGDRLIQGKGQFHTAALADPVALHGAHLLRPAIQLFQILQQFVGIGGDLQEPLGNLPPLHRSAGAPPPPIDDLLVGQHGLVHRIPVHRRHFPVHQPLFMQAGEEPLLPAVIVGIAGGKFPPPVEAEAQGFELLAHVIDVAAGPGGGGRLVGDGGIFRRQPEGVPAHGVQDVLTQHALVTGDDVGDGVVANVPHVQPATGVGEHGQAVVLVATEIVAGGKAAPRLPVRLGVAFEGLGVVVAFHVVVVTEWRARGGAGRPHRVSCHAPAEKRAS
jgi:hypothetical protein